MVAAQAAEMIAAEAADVAAAEATHVTAAEATSMSAATTAAAGLRTRCKQAAGKHRTCQNHHHSSSHDILL
jgi:hypothetical protein